MLLWHMNSYILIKSCHIKEAYSFPLQIKPCISSCKFSFIKMSSTFENYQLLWSQILFEFSLWQKIYKCQLFAFNIAWFFPIFVYFLFLFPQPPVTHTLVKRDTPGPLWSLPPPLPLQWASRKQVDQELWPPRSNPLTQQGQWKWKVVE